MALRPSSLLPHQVDSARFDSTVASWAICQGVARVVIVPSTIDRNNVRISGRRCRSVGGLGDLDALDDQLSTLRTAPDRRSDR